MPLSSDLISQFVKITKDDKKVPTETTVYGEMVVNEDGSTYVKIDGSDILTPVKTTVEAETGERVAVLLKNHTATVTGNLTSPAVRVETVRIIVDNITGLESVLADTINKKEFDDRVKPLEKKLSGIDISAITLTVADWVHDVTNNVYLQTISVVGVTTNTIIITTPAPASYAVASSSGVYCGAQADDSLTFYCATVPGVDVTMNLLIAGNGDDTETEVSGDGT